MRKLITLQVSFWVDDPGELTVEKKLEVKDLVSAALLAYTEEFADNDTPAWLQTLSSVQVGRVKKSD